MLGDDQSQIKQQQGKRKAHQEDVGVQMQCSGILEHGAGPKAACCRSERV